MPGGQFIQCLLFVPHAKNSGATRSLRSSSNSSSVKCFALLPRAIREQHPHICSLISQSGIQIIRNAALQSSVENSQLKVIEILIDGDTTPSGPLSLVVNEQNREMVKLLFDQGHPVRFKKKLRNKTIYTITEEMDVAIVASIFNSGADVSYCHSLGGTILHLAVERGQESLIKLLLDGGVDVHAERTNGWTPLFVAAEEGLAAISSLLIRSGAKVTHKDKHGVTAMHVAAGNDFPKIVEMLVQNGADVNALCNTGRTPLFVAAENGSAPIASLLIQNGAKVTHKDKHGVTAMHVAAGNDFPKIVEMLVQNGADVNAACDKGQTPVFWAAKNGHVGVLDDLFFFGADIRRKDNRDLTVMGEICEGKDFEILQRFLEHLYFVYIPSGICNGHSFLEPEFKSVARVFGSYSRSDLVSFHRSSAWVIYLTLAIVLVSCNESPVVIKEAIKIALDGSRKLGLSVSYETELRTKCSEAERETEIIDGEVIGNTSLTLRQIAAMSYSGLLRCARNNLVLQAMKARDLHDKFPNLGRFLSLRFQTGLRRRELMDQGIRACRLLIPEFKMLPDEIREQIVAYVSNRDLVVFLNVFANSPRGRSD